jgi:hypothetical protein
LSTDWRDPICLTGLKPIAPSENSINLKGYKMKKILLFLVIISVLVVIPALLLSQQTEILCCRPVCSGCGKKGYTLCDFKSVEECRNLDGWEVEDCTDCDVRKRKGP